MGMPSLPGFLSCGKKKGFNLSTGKNGQDGDENSERGNWSNKGDYLLSLVGYAVGLGNVWRFPYLAYQDGGGAFLIPYTVMLALAGLPLFFMECSLGQFASLGPISFWRILPLFQGVGVTMVLISMFVAVYYNVIIGYALYYLFASFQSVLPWSECFSWADEYCSKTRLVSDCNITLNGQNVRANYSFVVSNNLTCINGTVNYKPVQFPSEQYWNKVALQRSSGLDETGNIVWYLALCLLLAWAFVGGALFKGIKSSGKVVYFTALFPYVILLILLVRGTTLEGALDGIEYYIGKQSNITKLMEAEVWKDAATQIFYSLSVGWGGLVALSSYNKFNNNCYMDAILVCVINCVTSVFAGFAIFSILGHMAFVSDRPVSEVVDSGFDLAFVVYPEALTRLPISPLWSFLFFFMLLLLGLDSQFAIVETLTTAIQDMYPEVMRKLRIPITLTVCIVLYLLGLICVTQAGIYWINLIDHFCAGWGILFSAVLEIIGITYIYGGSRFIEDIEMMIGKKSWSFWLWWRICWYFLTPVLLVGSLISGTDLWLGFSLWMSYLFLRHYFYVLLWVSFLLLLYFKFQVVMVIFVTMREFINISNPGAVASQSGQHITFNVSHLQAVLIWSLLTFSAPTYGSLKYPAWGSAVGWFMIIFCVIWIPITAILKIVKAEGNLFQRIASCCRPASNWGPSLECNRGERYSHMVDPPKEKDHEIPTVSGLACS